MTRVYIGHIPYETRERDIERFFNGYGRIREVLLKRGYCFVEFNDPRDADDAVYDLNGRSILGMRAIVEIARSRPYKERGYYRGSRYSRSRSGSRSYRRDRSRSRSRSRRRTRSPSQSRSRSRSHSESRSASPKRSRRLPTPSPHQDDKSPRSDRSGSIRSPASRSPRSERTDGSAD